MCISNGTLRYSNFMKHTNYRNHSCANLPSFFPQVLPIQKVKEPEIPPKSPEELTSENILNTDHQNLNPPESVVPCNETIDNGFIKPDLPRLGVTDFDLCTKEDSRYTSHCSASSFSSKLSNCSKSSLSSVRSVKSNIEELEKRIPKIDETAVIP
ncbi:unnamed protein product [Heterobilharzia americana]|nr:unnamed protein product [Heterobilharzia americana]